MNRLDEAPGGATSATASATAAPTDAHPFAALLEGVDKIYRTDRIETIALSNINLDIRAGEFVAVMGPSGSGKSTLLNILGLLDSPSAGRLAVGGHEIVSLRDRQLATLRNRTIGFVFQVFHLIADLNVVDNVELPLLYRGSPSSERRRLARESLEKVGLSARMHHFPHQLSGGQMQRVAIARAIVGRPRILLADEPTGNLDSQMGGEIMEILETLHREEGTTIVTVTHDAGLAARTQRIVRLFDGRQVH
jgi:putative ABC transport system ATP-binding protein